MYECRGRWRDEGCAGTALLAKKRQQQAQRLLRVGGAFSTPGSSVAARHAGRAQEKIEWT